MKQLTLSIIMLLAAATAYGQRPSKEERQSLVESKRIQYKHDFRVGGGWMTPNGYWRLSVPGGTTTNYGATGYLFYGYRFHGGWKVALTVGYNTVNHTWQEFDPTNFAHKTTHEVNSHNLRISPAIQYEWYRRGLVTMYSDLGFTWVIPSSHMDGFYNHKPMGYITPNVTPFGITVGGKHWFGAVELFSFGARGFFNAAVGYRF